MQFVGAAVDRQRAVVLDREHAFAHQRRRLHGGVAGDLGEVAGRGAGRGGRRRRGRAAAGRRPGGSSAARSAAPSRRSRGPRPGRRRPARPAAARGWRGRWSAACAARARRRRRTRAGAASSSSRSERAASSERSICSRVGASSPTSSSTAGFGIRFEGRGWPRSRARPRSARRSAASPGRRSRRRRGWRAACRRGRRRGSAARAGRRSLRRGGCCARTGRSRRRQFAVFGGDLRGGHPHPVVVGDAGAELAHRDRAFGVGAEPVAVVRRRSARRRRPAGRRSSSCGPSEIWGLPKSGYRRCGVRWPGSGPRCAPRC